MPLIAPRIKRYKGTLTTDGTGAASINLTPGTGYKLFRATGSNPATGGLTGGTVVFRDNNGTGTAVNDTHSTPQTTTTFDKTYNVTTIVTDLKITIATGGATKVYGYDVTFYRTRAH
jgi:hypothetical protein